MARNTWGQPKLQTFTERQFDSIPHLARLSSEQRFNMRVVANVLPFRVNQYVLDELIDWDNIPDDPMFRLTFPQPEMLPPAAFASMADAFHSGAERAQLMRSARSIQAQLNPHPAGQQELNTPNMGDENLEGMQHKYKETVLFFPAQGQVCHSYCTFCFRWAQFVGDKELRFASNEASKLQQYLLSQPQVSDLLITGGDPMVMKSTNLAAYIEALTQPEFEHVQTIRIGTKSLSFWPYRFVTDPDADDLLRLFSRLVNSGKHIAFMSHFNHWRELETPIVREAIRRLRDSGVVIRSQAPVLKNINDSAEVWARMWRTQVKLGIVPYYMFVERDTGARQYFELPLAQTWKIYREAMKQVSGLARTARGPSMSSGPGKIEIQGIANIADERVFVLRFIQGRNPDWVQRPFFAKFDDGATWYDQLQPAFGEKEFFFQAEYNRMLNGANIV